MRKIRSYNSLHVLPIVEYAATFFPKDNLKNVYLIACQHLLPSTHMMLRSMMKLGLEVDRISMIGKCYSSDDSVIQSMRDEGIYVCESSNKFDSFTSFDNQFRKSIRSFLKDSLERMEPSEDSTIIVLDDGGELITEAQYLKDIYPNIFGVEQTSSGYHKLRKVDLKFPIKNVAFSMEKLHFESPFIADTVLLNLEKKINLTTAPPKNILIAGNGEIGKSTAVALRGDLYSQHTVQVFDLLKSKSEIEYLDFSVFDLIIGATGNTMLTHNYYELLKKGVVMANIASSDREFDAVYFRKLSGKKWNVHDDVEHNGISLLNAGFPINFSGGTNVSLPLNIAQVVCALLFLGVNDINVSGSDKFVNLKFDMINKIFHKFYTLFCDEGDTSCGAFKEWFSKIFRLSN